MKTALLIREGGKLGQAPPRDGPDDQWGNQGSYPSRATAAVGKALCSLDFSIFL